MLNTIVYPDAVATQAVRILTTEYRRAILGVGWRLRRAMDLMQAGHVEPVTGWGDPDGTLYRVRSQYTPHQYIVDTLTRTCTCDDFATTGQRCKHMLAVSLTLLARNRLGFVPEIDQEIASAGEDPDVVRQAVASLDAYLQARSAHWSADDLPAEALA